MFDFNKDLDGNVCPLKYDAPTMSQRECSPNCVWYDEYYGKCAILVLTKKRRGDYYER